MKLSRAMAVAADGLALEKQQLRIIAQTLEAEQRGRLRRTRSSAAAGRFDRGARQETVLALQASRRLLVRTIDMLT